MKTKKLCMMIVIAMVFTVSINAFADCGKCEKAKPAKCCKQKPAQKVELKAEVKKEEDQDIPLSQVPKNIKEIAEKAVKGLKLTEAELEDGIYELEGYVGDVEYEIKITPEGKVIKIEKEDKDKDKDDDNEEEFDD